MGKSESPFHSVFAKVKKESQGERHRDFAACFPFRGCSLSVPKEKEIRENSA